jgi:UDP-N-acetylmuramyl pentapeptide phosphotransferase/UDP-N-acetylglucosamine-1-phosphate transferase
MTILAAIAVVVFAASGAATGAMTWWLRRRTILDHPVERSSHKHPTPKGAGAAIVPIVLVCWLLLAGFGYAPAETPLICSLALALAALSWINDLTDLPAALRLAMHFLIVGIGTVLLPVRGIIFQGLLPPAADMVLTALLWTWFINLFNFMDGIDGISAIETASIGVGLVALAAVAGPAVSGEIELVVVLIAAVLGFLPWNWHPARVFLGDVGSVPIGFVVGWLLLIEAGRGCWASALLLPLYYLCDASITLGRRILRGEKIWQAHRSHFYQRALGTGDDHAAVVGYILLGNLGLIGSALIAIWRPLPALGAGALIVASLLMLLARRGRRCGLPAEI